MNPQVSVIIPNYNHAPFLKERIDSVINQHYDNFEVIILDDCSKDNSREVIEQYRNHPKVKHIVYNEANSGSTFIQWHKGFRLAEGEYIWIAESDDVADLDFLTKLTAAINGDKSITIAASALYYIDEQGKVTGKGSISKTKKTKYYSGKDFIKSNMLLGNHLLNASSAIIRKSAIQDIPSNYTKLRASGDYLFWIELANCGNVVEVPLPLDYFRRSSSCVTFRLHASGVAFEEAHIVYDRLRELGYATGYYRHVIVGFRLWEISNSTRFSSADIKRHCLSIWKKETRTPRLDIALCYFHGAMRKTSRIIRNLW